MKKRTRIVLADDHTIIRQGLRLLLDREEDFEVIGEASDGYEAMAAAETLKPDVLVLDLAMPRLNGIEAARQIAQKAPSAAIVILSMHADESYVLHSLKAGARAYLLKDSVDADLITAVRAVSEGKAYFSPTISRLLADEYVRGLRDRGVEDTYDLLTSRERQILQLIAEGRSNKEIATILDLSAHTVESHRGNLMHKLNLHSAPELVLYAVRKGVIS